MKRSFISGASGNVGRALVREARARGYEVVGGWCREAGSDLGELAGIGSIGVIASRSLKEGIASSRPDVVIDFTATQTLAENFRTYIETGVDVVAGTTGLALDEIERAREEVSRRGLRWAVIPNYSLGVDLVTKFVREASKAFSCVSVTDRHMLGMANAPSGTAEQIARAASHGDAPKCASEETIRGALGASIEGVRVHSERLPFPGPYSEHEIVLGRQDELIRIRIESHSSGVFMDGVFMTADKISTSPPGTFFTSLSEVLERR